jgi:Na+-driven multidrug efflux pump
MEPWDKTMTVSVVLAIVAGFVLVGHWSPKEHKVVWWGAGIGTILGVVLMFVTGAPYLFPLNCAVGTFAGAVFEWIGRIIRRLRDGY